uniref:T9SS type A sorting domain-containing protein n=1 Tax=uncultured Tenacibaculum sp. TaxID=174713 RepID=UPI00260E3257
TDNQDLTLNTNTLSLSNDASTVDLAKYLDNTDAQTISLAGTNLSIANGNTIDISSLQDGTGTDNQNLTSAALSGNDLIIAIENGTSVSVDLSPILSDIKNDLLDSQTEVSELKTQMATILSRLEKLEECGCSNTSTMTEAILYQNIPNPFSNKSSIGYFLPENSGNASIIFNNSTGQIISTIEIKEKGEGDININTDGLASGIYYYTLYVNSERISTRKMIIN